jgi:hypothetical protein
LDEVSMIAPGLGCGLSVVDVILFDALFATRQSD